SGQSVAFDLVVTLPNDGTTSITDHATVSSDTNDPDTSDNSADVVTDICQSVDLALTKECDNVCPIAGVRKTACEIAPITEIQGGNDFQYTITVTNNDASVAATNVTITDTLPASVSYVSDDGGCDTSALPTITCSTSSLAAGGGSFTVSIVVKAIESGPSENSATASADQCDRNTDDNTSSCSVTIDTNNMPTALEADREGCSNGSSPFCTGDADSVATSSDMNRVFEPGETVRVDPAWTNTLDNDDPDVTGIASSPTSPAGGTLTIDDDTADYGAIPAGKQSDCNGITATSPDSTGTGDCYNMTVTEDVEGVRPAQHWDTHFTETLSSGEVKTWTLHIGDSFTDVLRGNFFYRFVETIYHNGITVGGGVHCTRAQFCPAQATRRDQLTAFVARSLENGTDALVPVSGTGYDCSGSTSNFTDTPAHSTFCRHANFLFVNHIVNGCAPNLLCAADPTTRGQMAAVVDRAIQWQAGHTADPDGAVPTSGTDGSTRTYDCTSGPGPFSDVPNGSTFCKYIGDLWVRHVVDGFNDGTYRPGTTIRRDEASKLLTNAFVNVPLYGPLPGLGL
ncbi:MAG TPA: S-layer homology domain-containing protein, partial [Thermoanaerobaculia bacterium]|nr:S-layer homology domain-containing protein [Thermoanaerobaculia bacterium]